MMFKRPQIRARCKLPTHVGKPPEGSFLHSIVSNTETKVYTFVKQPVYQMEEYCRALETNNKKLGIPYVKPNLPEPTPYVPPDKPNEPRLEYGDQVYVTLRVLKSGVVRVKVNCAIAMMYEKYYRHAVQPPFKTVLQAYKSHGFSQQFLERIKKSQEKKVEFAKKVPGILAKIFDKEPVKKIKKKKEKEREDAAEVVDEVPEEEVEEEQVPDEEGELDIEPEEEPEEVEEDYYSDPET